MPSPLFSQAFFTDRSGERIVIYVRSTGDDATGDGTTVATSYRTVRRALQELPAVINGQRYTIDCTGIGAEDLPEQAWMSGFHFPSVCGRGTSVQNYDDPIAPYFNTENEITISAVPTELREITENDGELGRDGLTGLQYFEAKSGLFADDEFTAKFVVSDTGLTTIAACSGRTLQFASREGSGLEVSLPFKIVELSTELRLDGTSFSGLSLEGCRASVAFNGIRVRHDTQFIDGYYATCTAPIVVTGTLGCTFTLCDVEGIRIGPNMAVVYALATTIDNRTTYQDTASYSSDPKPDISYQNRRLDLHGGGLTLQNCFLRNLVLDQRHCGNLGTFQVLASVVYGCTPLGHNGMVPYHSYFHEESYLMYRIRWCHVREALYDGIDFLGGPLGHVWATRIENSSKHGVYARGQGRFELDWSGGDGNGEYGLIAVNATHINALVNAPADQLRGTLGDHKIGDLAVGMWTPGPEQVVFDFQGDGSRLWMRGIL